MLGIHFSLFPLSHGHTTTWTYNLICCPAAAAVHTFSHNSSLAIFFCLRRSCGLPDCIPAWTTMSQVYSQLACPFSLFHIYISFIFGGQGALRGALCDCMLV